MEKVVTCTRVEDKVGKTSGKPYKRFSFSDGSGYNGMKFMKIFEGKTYRLLIVQNGTFENIDRADEVTGSAVAAAGMAQPQRQPGQFAYCPHCAKPVSVEMHVTADLPVEALGDEDGGR